MRYVIRVVSAALAVLALASSGDSSTGPTYSNIAGTYAGALAGISQGVTLQANFTLTVTQSAGVLGGSYSLVGTLLSGAITAPLQGTGTLAGTIAAGNNPSVNVTATSGLCPNVRSIYSGAYDSVNAVITLNGTLNVFDLSTCQILLSYPGTIILRR